MRFILLVSLVMGLLGCGAQQEELMGRPPQESLVESSPRQTNIKLTREKKRVRDQPEPVFAINGWPLMEEGTTFRLTWDGPRTQMKVVDEPSYNGVLADQITFEKGQDLRWDGTSVGVFKPSIYRVTSEFLLEGFEYAPDAYRTGGESFSAELKPNERIELFHYAGSGLCYMRVRKKMVEALCPPEPHFAGNFKGQTLAAKYQPLDAVWWIRVPGPKGGGWFPLDDRVIVDIIN